MLDEELDRIKPFEQSKDVLLIEDNIELSELVEIHLSNLNLHIDKAFDGITGLNKARRNYYNLIILDLFLPRIDGIEVCRALRASGDLTPVLILSSRAEDFDKVGGFKVGANAYLTKPFNLITLIRNVKNLLVGDYNIKVDKPSNFFCNTLVFKDFTFDTKQQLLIIKNSIIPMDEKEQQLLGLLICNPGIVYSRSEILKLIWGFDLKTYRYKVTSLVNRVRQKIELDFLNPHYILVTDEGGFKFNEEIEPILT